MKLIKLLFFALALLAILNAVAMAVTYRNDGTSPVTLKNKNGSQVMLMPGKQVETYYYADLTDPANANLTKVSDAPYAKTALQSDDVGAGGSASMNLATDVLVFVVLSGSVSVYEQSTSNAPPLLQDWTEDKGPFKIGFDGTFDTLAVAGSGTVRIIQYKISY